MRSSGSGKKQNFFWRHFNGIAMAAIVLIPTIYTTLFLGSMWDPYGNVDQLPVAVVNNDKSVDYEGKELAVGDELVDKLRENDQLDFHFVSADKAEKGIEDGTYYMVITIPENFSENASTLMDDEPQKMELQYVTNPGTNYIASKMSETALAKIQKEVSESVTKEYTTGGEILIGVVGPVRTGKSTLIKQFMEQLVLPAIGPADAKLRARDELPQSAAGRTIMTTEPKFIPEQAVPLQLEGGGECRIRLIDCVGYMVEGAMGHEEDEKPRMVKSPWFEEEIPFDLAAETGTRKVIRDHSTIGIVVTTDGSISEIPRENYLPAEKRVVEELEALGKPFVILLNSTCPDAPETKALAAELEQAYGRTVLPVSCLDLQKDDLLSILQRVLYEFPVRELDFAIPRWVTMLEKGHWLQNGK